MTPIQFNEPASQKIYSDYIKRIKNATKILNANDKLDLLMEINSHIFESFQDKKDTGLAEVDRLLSVLDSLGAPEVILKPVVADLKLTQATNTFNPIHVFKALLLNISSGIFYIIIAVLYLFLFVFIFLIGAKILYPSEVGMYFRDGNFIVLGSLDNATQIGAYEVFGVWFIPIMIVVAVLWYLIITLLLRLKRNKK